MSSRPLLLVLALGCVLTSARAAEKKTPAPGTLLTPASVAEKKARAAAVDSGLTTYYVCLLTKGAFAGVGLIEERKKTQIAQNAYISELARTGKLLVAGPFADNSEWRGIYIFKCASLAEAQTLALGDPMVRASRLKFEIHPWITEQGSIRDPEFPAAK